MPDTPNFIPYRTRFEQLDLATVLDTSPPIDEPYRTILSDAHAKVQRYFVEDQFRQSLTTSRRNNIESQINAVLDQLNQIAQYRSQGVLPQNIEGITNNIQAYLDEIDMRFTQPLITYQLQGNEDLAATIGEARDASRKISVLKSEAESTLETAKLLVGMGAGTKLADFYQRLATGRTVDEEDKYHTAKPQTNLKKILWILSAAVLLGLFSADDIYEGFVSVKDGGAIPLIRLGIVGVGLLSLLSAFILKKINQSKPGGHERAAAGWALGGVVAVVITAIYAAFLVRELGSDPGWEQIIPKLVGLLAPAYLVRFCIHNYRVNMHLAVVNVHRATVSRVARGFADQIATQHDTLRREELQAQGAVIEKAAEVVFAPAETGYITTKEGAGNASDSIFDGTPLGGRGIS